MGKREEKGFNPISSNVLKPLLENKEYKGLTSLYERHFNKEFVELQQYYTTRQWVFVKSTVIKLLQTIDIVSYSIGGEIAINHYWFRLKSALKKVLKGTDLTLKSWLERKGMLLSDNHYIVDIKSMHYRTGTPSYLVEELNKLYTKGLLDKAQDIRLVVANEKRLEIKENIKIVNTNLEKLEKKNYFSRSFFSKTVGQKVFKTLIKGIDTIGYNALNTIENKAKLKIENILSNSHKIWDKDILESYVPTRLSYTGRVYQVQNQGTQGLPRLIKQRNLRAMRKVWGKENAINYDMPSAQLNALLEIAEQVGLELPYLKEYLDNPNAREQIAKLSGLDKKVVKLLVLSYIFGAKSCISEDFAHKDILRDFYGSFTSTLNENYTKFLDITSNLVSDIRKFLNKSIDIAKMLGVLDLDQHKANNKVVEVDLSLLENELGTLSKSKVTAFLLQGKEQEFILEVMNLLDKHNIDILSYEFDGLVTEGVIPQELLNLARIRTNFKRANLISKDFCDESLEVV